MRTRKLDKRVTENQKAFERDFGTRYTALRDAIDEQHALTRIYYGFLGASYLTNHSSAEKPIFSALTKNELALYASLSLVRDGLYGVALSQLRLIYEALMIAKTCSILKEHPFVEKWISGETIYFAKGVLGRIQAPPLDELRKLWPILCEHSHATVYSIQVETEYKEIKQHISGALAVIGMLICCNFHLLNRHFITPSMIYLGKRYLGKEEFINKRNKAKSATEELKKFLSFPAKKLVREYAASWQIDSTWLTIHSS